MAGPLRIEYPGAFYHVMHRGNAGSDIFKSVRDREKFLEYVGKAVARYEIKIHTYKDIGISLNRYRTTRLKIHLRIL
jgi:putative transposase